MLAHVVHLQPCFDWLLRTTWQASVLIGLILLVQTILGRRLGVRARYCLWLVLLIRMATPWAPQSGLSLYSVLPIPSLGRYEARVGRLAYTIPSAAGPVETIGSAADEMQNRPPASHPKFRGRWLVGRTAVLLSLVWLAGALCVAGCIAAGNIRLCRILRRGQPVTDPWVIGILEECKRLMGIRAVLAVVATDEVRYPALCGILRPRLLLPERTLAEADPGALRHIVLHELAHLKRHDIVVGHVASVLHALHWFNPLIAVGLRRMRTDRELACDALALSVLHPDETSAYGHTIVHQMERLLTSQPRWSMAGLCGDRARVRERIAMICWFRKGSHRWSPPALLLVGCLAGVALTQGPIIEPPSNPWDAYARRHFPTTHQDRHANIHRCNLRNITTGKYLVVEGERVVGADEPGESGLWEVRFDENLGSLDQIGFFYSVTTGRYLTWDKQRNIAANGLEPDETARWAVWTMGGAGDRIVPYPFGHLYLRVMDEGDAKTPYGTHPEMFWDIHRVWRIKTSNNPKSDPEFQREKIPGPD